MGRRVVLKLEVLTLERKNYTKKLSETVPTQKCGGLFGALVSKSSFWYKYLCFLFFFFFFFFFFSRSSLFFSIFSLPLSSRDDDPRACVRSFARKREREREREREKKKENEKFNRDDDDDDDDDDVFNERRDVVLLLVVALRDVVCEEKEERNELDYDDVDE